MRTYHYIIGMGKSSPRKRKVIPVHQGIMIREAAPQTPNSPSIPAEDKGKRIAVEPLPPKKRKRTVPLSELKEGSSASKAELKDMITPYLSLDEAAGPSGQVLAAQVVTSVVEVLNLDGGDLWSNIHLNKVDNLLDSGIRSSVIVSVPSLSICFHSHVVFITISLLHLQLFPTEHYQPPPLQSGARKPRSQPAGPDH